MRKPILSFTTLFIIAIINFNSVKAQSQPGQMALNAGLGLSFVFPVEDGQLKQTLTGSGESVSYTITPAYSGIFDIGLAQDFSMGACVGYQSTTINYINYPNPSNNLPENIQQNITRLNVGVRGMWHFVATEKIDAYIGGRVGWSMWNNTSSDPSDVPPWPLFYSDLGPAIGLPSFQGFIGVRMYVLSNVGLHAELAIGTPYLLEGGITIKIGGSADSDESDTPVKSTTPNSNQIQVIY